MVSDRTTDRLFLYHGGVPGLRPGDLTEPGHPRGPYRRKFEALGPLREIDPPARSADLVYLTPSRIYAAGFAHAYPHGDLYRVEPVGVVDVSGEDGAETYTAPAARVIAAVDRAVILTASEERRAAREANSAWNSYRSSVKHVDADEAERLTARGLYYGGRPGLDAGANLGPDASLTNSPRWAVGAAERWPHGDLYRVEPVGPLACGKRGALIVCAAPGAVVTSVLSRGHGKPGTEAGDMGDRLVTTVKRPAQGA